MMLSLHARFFGSPRPAHGWRFPASTLVSVLDGTETLHLVGRQDVLAEQVADIEPFADITLELRPRKIDLAALGGSGRGKAYRLRIVRVIHDPEEAR
jgi:hypothetical protein